MKKNLSIVRFCPVDYTLGRSMVEMLGVFAIVGVLSIGGLTAYRQAMERHQMNQLKDFTNRIAFSIKEQCGFSESCPFGTDVEKNKQLLCLTMGPDMCGEGVWSILSFMPNVRWYFTLKEVGPSSEAFFLRYNGLTNDECAALMDRNWEENVYFVSVGESNGIFLTHPNFPPKSDCAALNGGVVYIVWWKD